MPRLTVSALTDDARPGAGGRRAPAGFPDRLRRRRVRHPLASQPVQIPLDLFQVPEGLEVTVWADVAAAAQPDQHRHRSRRAHLGGGRGSLPLASCPAARRRSHRRAGGHRPRRQGRQHAYVRAGTGADRPARRLGDRQQGGRRAAARPHRLHGRRSEPAVRSGGGQARGAPDRVPGHQPRPLAPLGDGRPGRQMGVQLRQHRGQCSRTSRGRRSASSAPIVTVPWGRSSSRTTRRPMPESPATTGMCTSAGSPCG